MGYHTEFSGSFDISPQLWEGHRLYLTMFARTRRVRRDALKTAERSDPIRFAVDLPPGKDGEYFVSETGFRGQDIGPDVVNHNDPPMYQPSLWCQWTPNDDGKRLIWDGGEKFYEYIEWLGYLLSHFFKPWGYILNGIVTWAGESEGDTGTITVEMNCVTIS